MLNSSDPRFPTNWGARSCVFVFPVAVKSIEDLSTIFKELAVLVIDQGTILDRIDFNMEQVQDCYCCCCTAAAAAASVFVARLGSYLL